MRNLTALAWVVGILIAGNAALAQQGVSDAIVLVQPMGTDLMVATTYSAVVDHGKVKQRLLDLGRHAGWSGGTVEIKDESIKTNAQKDVGRQTEATILYRGAAAIREGGFILQPFVQAFSDLRRIELLFFVQGQPGFVGLRYFDDPALSVHLTRDGGPYQYLVVFKDRTKPIPVLPHTQAVEQPVKATPAAAAQPAKQPISMAFVVAVAAGCGLVVLGALLLLGSMRAKQPRRPEPRITRTRKT